MNKLNIGLIVALIIFVGANVFQFIFWNNTNKETAEKYTEEVANLQATVSSYGEEIEVYTVKENVKAGDEIEEDMLETMKMYSSLMTEQYIKDPEEIIGRYYKIAVNPGTPLLKNMVMDEELVDSMRDRDIILSRVTVGLEEGDYIDVRMTMPYGDDYVVLSHKRVYSITENTIKLYLTELEWNLYQGAMVDFFLNTEYGCVIYADKYVEPGLQQKAVNYYAVPSNIAALLQKNPNIVDKEEAASLNDWRKSLEELLVIFRDNDDTVDADGSRLATGRAGLNDAVNTDQSAYSEAKKEAEELAAEQEAEAEAGEEGDDYWDEDPTSDSATYVEDSVPSTEMTDEEGM